ncbi:alginate lyase family protein [Kushneria sp. EE4]
MYSVEKALYLSLCTQGLYNESYLENKDIEISDEECPRTIILDGVQLARLKALFKAGDAQCMASMQALLEKADSLLEMPCYSVTQKGSAPAGASINDYVSLAKYWWPNPDSDDELPYIRKDGHVNPDCYSESYDASRFVRMTERVQVLALAGFISQNKKMAEKAVEQLTVWFLDQDKAQTPHFEWSQRIPGREKARGASVIEARHLIYIIESVRILEFTSSIDEHKKQAFQTWCRKALDWFRHSEIGQQAKIAKNNIGFWYDLTCIGLADFVEEKHWAKTFIEEDVKPRFEAQVADDGGLIEELKRERPQDYVAFTLVAMSQLSRFGDNYGLPLWDQLKADGKGFEFAHRWLLDQAQLKEATVAGNYLKAGVNSVREGTNESLFEQETVLAGISLYRKIGQIRLEEIVKKDRTITENNQKIENLEKTIERQTQNTEALSHRQEVINLRKQLLNDKDARIKALEENVAEQATSHKDYVREAALKDKIKKQAQRTQKIADGLAHIKSRYAHDTEKKDEKIQKLEAQLQKLEEEKNRINEESQHHKKKRIEFLEQKNETREKLDQANERLELLTKENTANQTALTELQEKYSVSRKEYLENIQALEASLKEEQALNNKRKSRETTLEKELKNYKNRTKELETLSQGAQAREKEHHLKDKKLAQAKNKSNNLERKVKNLEAKIDALHNSRSWRLTQSLRALSKRGGSHAGSPKNLNKISDSTNKQKSATNTSDKANDKKTSAVKDTSSSPEPEPANAPKKAVAPGKTGTAPSQKSDNSAFQKHPLEVLKGSMLDSVDWLKEESRQSGLDEQKDTFVLYRIIGNDLYPRHAKGQSRNNVEFILNNEQPLEGCVKKWIVNRIFDSSEEAQIISLLEAHHQDYIHLPFDPVAYERLDFDTSILPHENYLTSKEFHDLKRFEKRRIYTAVHRLKNNYAMNNNGARNVALDAGRKEYKWVLPWDGNCFLTPSAWEQVKREIQEQSYFKYFAVPMARVLDNDALLNEDEKLDPAEEPQLVFRRDAQERFNEAYSYGRRPKVEMFWRLGMPGKWDMWVDESEDQPRRPLAPEAYQWGVAGWVARLFSGMKEQEVENGAVNRNQRRQDAIVAFLQQLDRQVAERESNSDRSLVAKSQALPGEQNRPFYFGIPVRSKACTNNWEVICTNLERTLLNLSRQENKNFKVLIAVHEIPSIRTFDLDVEFLIADFAPPINSDGTFGNDKGPKKRMISMALSEQTQAPFYYMPLDADDLVHPSLVHQVLEDDNKRGYLIARGYIFNQATSSLTPCDESNTEYWKHCGSCAVFHLEHSDLPMSRMSSDAYIFTLKRHTEFPELAEQHGKPLEKFSDYMGIYIINHGENNRLVYRGGWNNKDEFTDRFHIRSEAEAAAIFQDYPELVIETEETVDV